MIIVSKRIIYAQLKKGINKWNQGHEQICSFRASKYITILHFIVPDLIEMVPG